MKPIDLTGKRFGRLVPLRLGINAGTNRRWICRCDCGNEKTIQASALRTGTTKSCGCLLKEASGDRARRHGKTGTRVYRIWQAMLRRCRNPNYCHWECYGGRGIKVCERWLKFENFYADMCDCPSGYSIERADVNGNYEPSNCMWIPMKDQWKNTRSRQKRDYAVEAP